jgi:hypothetical protein
MTLTTMDIYLVVLIVASLVVGFFWGATRSLMMVAAWLVAFVAGAYLRLQLGSYLASEWSSFAVGFSEMAAYGLIYLAILVAAPVLIVVSTRGSQRFFSSQGLDDIVGALIAGGVAVLAIAGIMAIFATYYGQGEPVVVAAGGPQWTADVYQALLDSTVGGFVDERVIPVLGNILGPILPPDVREVMV